VPRLRRPAAAVLAAVLTLAGAGACSKDRDDAGAPASATTSTTALTAPPTIGVEITGVEANGTAAPDEATVGAVKTALDAWLAAAVVGPLFTGQPAGDLSAAFTPAALERIAADPAVRSTLVAEGLPPASTSITAERSTAALSSVAGPDGVVAVVAASLDVLLRATGPTVDVDVNHYGEVVLVADASGIWKIDSFTITTKQDSRA
jgi:hypothetical protein